MSNTKSTTVISAFPGCGKTYAYTHYQNQFTMLDSDSSLFHWATDETGNKFTHPDWPQNYIDHIITNLGKVDFIFVSSHEEIRKALSFNAVPFMTVLPNPSCKEQWLQRLRDRGSTPEFVRLIESKWKEWTDVENMQHIGLYYMQVNADQYLDIEMLKYIRQRMEEARAKLLNDLTGD